MLRRHRNFFRLPECGGLREGHGGLEQPHYFSTLAGVPGLAGHWIVADPRHDPDGVAPGRGKAIRLDSRSFAGRIRGISIAAEVATPSRDVCSLRGHSKAD